MKLFERLKPLFVELILPRRARCMACGSSVGCDRDDICEDCRRKLARNWIGVCGPNAELHLADTAYAHPYAGPGGGLVRSLKYLGVRVLADEMGKELARAVELMHIEHVQIVTAVPMHPRRQYRRGMNHAELLAREVAAHRNMQYCEILMRTRNAPQQARLDEERRLQNLRGGFAVCPQWRDEIAGKDVLLIDDVLTTGGTAAACVDALRAAGVNRIYFAAYASGGGNKKHG